MIVARLIRTLLWLIVFVAPLIGAGYPLPYGVLVLVPALAAVDGTSVRRVGTWIGLALLFEFLYRIPLGTLSLSVLMVAGLDGSIRRSIRLDADALRISMTVRRLLRGALWIIGLIVASACVAWLLYDASFAVVHIVSLWYRVPTGGAVTFVALLCFALLNRFTYRVPGERTW